MDAAEVFCGLFRRPRFRGASVDLFDGRQATLSDQAGEEGRTDMLFEQRGSLPAEVYEHAKEGWSTFFDRIAERLATPDTRRTVSCSLVRGTRGTGTRRTIRGEES